MKVRLLSLNPLQLWRNVLLVAVCLIIAGVNISYAREHSSPTVGPATEAKEPSPPNVSPLKYQNYTCDQITAEMDLTANRIRVLQETQEYRIDLARPHISSGEKVAEKVAKTVAQTPALGLLALPVLLPYAVAEGQRRAKLLEEFLKQFNENLQTGHKMLDGLETVAREKECAVPMTAKITKWSSLAREKARASCKFTGLPELQSVTGNLEDYRVPCNFAVPLNLRCDSTGCQETAPGSGLTKAAMASNEARDPGVSGRPLRVAILQVGFLPQFRIRFLDSITESVKFTEELINENPFLDLKHAYYSGEVLPPVKNAFGFIRGSLGIWGKERDEPLKYSLFDHWTRNKPDVDVIFSTAFEIGRAGPVNLEGEEFKLISSDIYLFDVSRRQMYFVNGGDTADQIQQSIEELFSGYLKSIGMTAPEPAVLSAERTQAPGSDKLRMAILPFWGRNNFSRYIDNSDERIEELATEAIFDNPQVELGFSSYSDRIPNDMDLDLDRIWESTGARYRPRKAALSEVGSKLLADAILLVGYRESGGTSTDVSTEVLELEVYVFDVLSQKMHSSEIDIGSVTTSDAEAKVRAVIRAELSKFIAGHKRHATAESTGATRRSERKSQVQEIAAVPPNVALATQRNETRRVPPAIEPVQPERREESADQSPGKTPESGPPIAVAIFPFAGRAIVVNDAEHLLPKFAHQFVSDDRQLRLLANYFGQKDSNIGGRADYWTATNQPKDSRVFSDAARIRADVVLMYSYSGSLYMDDRFDVTVYVIDVRNRRVHQSAGNQDNYKAVTNRLFEDLIASW